MKTYATASNARRAARKALGARAVEGNNGDFEVKELGKKSYTWEPVTKAPAATKAEPVAPPKAEGRHCPACEIDIDDNGFDQDDKTGALTCLGCGHQWGGTVTTGKKEYRKGAVREVWDICEENKDLRRKDVIDICVAKGINYYTARTQYQAWRTAHKNSQ